MLGLGPLKGHTVAAQRRIHTGLPPRTGSNQLLEEEYTRKIEHPKVGKQNQPDLAGWPPVLPENLIRPLAIDLFTFGCGPWEHDFMAPSGLSDPR